MRPPFTYYGGKVGMSGLVCQLLPPHRVYLEPFFGSGAVFFAKTPAVHEIINDLDDAVVAFFRCLRDRPTELAEVCELSPTARAEFDAADVDEDDVEDLERARRFWVRVNQSFAKTAGRRTGWSVTTARSQSVAASIQSRLGRFRVCARRLAEASIEHCDAVDLIHRFATPDTVIYADPPYLYSRRVRHPGSNQGDYRHDMGADEAHERLGEALVATPATVILSGYPSPLYDRLYAGWEHLDVAVTAFSSNGALAGRAARVERVWSNRPLRRQLSLFADAAVESVG